MAEKKKGRSTPTRMARAWATAEMEGSELFRNPELESGNNIRKVFEEAPGLFSLPGEGLWSQYDEVEPMPMEPQETQRQGRQKRPKPLTERRQSNEGRGRGRSRTRGKASAMVLGEASIIEPFTDARDMTECDELWHSIVPTRGRGHRRASSGRIGGRGCGKNLVIDCSKEGVNIVDVGGLHPIEVPAAAEAMLRVPLEESHLYGVAFHEDLEIPIQNATFIARRRERVRRQNDGGRGLGRSLFAATVAQTNTNEGMPLTDDNARLRGQGRQRPPRDAVGGRGSGATRALFLAAIALTTMGKFWVLCPCTSYFSYAECLGFDSLLMLLLPNQVKHL
jgi:hypothetical protein